MDRPEVNPVVTNMPTEGNRLHSGGSARIRSIDLTDRMINDTTCSFAVTGVPGHTHNASAVISVIADYSKLRDRLVQIEDHVWGNDPGGYDFLQNYPTDSVLPPDFEERAERAIERGIGNIEMVPENCNSFIAEPTRSISEIRTLVTPADMHNTLTYVEETSGWQRVDEDGVMTPLVSSFPDVVVDIIPIWFHSSGAFFASATEDVTYSMHEDGTTFNGGGVIQPVIDGGGNIAPDWDGCLVFSWDTEEHLYISKEVTFTPYIVSRPAVANSLPLTTYCDVAAGHEPELKPALLWAGRTSPGH